MNEEFFTNDAVDFSQYILKSARAQEANGEKRNAAKTFAHAWRCGASGNNPEISNIARVELFSIALLVNDLIFASSIYRDLLSTFSLENRFHGACAHHDLGKIYRNAWEYNEIVNPNDAIKHLIAAKDEFTDLNQTRNAACVEMDLAHIYINIQKIEQAVELLFSARKKWEDIHDIHGRAESALSIGDCYTLLGENEDAEKYFSIASNEFENAGITHENRKDNSLN